MDIKRVRILASLKTEKGVYDVGRILEEDEITSDIIAEVKAKTGTVEVLPAADPPSEPSIDSGKSSEPEPSGDPKDTGEEETQENVETSDLENEEDLETLKDPEETENVEDPDPDSENEKDEDEETPILKRRGRRASSTSGK